MNFKSGLFTSESVTEGHPDKIADQISDAVLDAVLTQDPRGRVACETLVTTGLAMISGEITTTAVFEASQVARDVIKRIGYDNDEKGFDYKTCGVIVSLGKQSPDISQGVTEGEGLHKEQGAGDQGLMFGYASDETEDLMPATLHYAHKLTKRLAETRKNETLKFLRPDGKSQVTLQYDNGQIKRAEAIVVSTQHEPNATHAQIVEGVREEVIKKVMPASWIDNKTKVFINPTGRFVVGGPMGDCGLTGRKIIVDTYGGHGAHGGGAFSGKDPSKVDRSASYMGRYIAKNIVAAGLAKRCLVQIAYAIGVAEPVSLLVYDYETGKVSNEKLVAAVKEVFGLKPAEIIKTLDLLKPMYEETASYGHFGRTSSKGFTWEKTDRVDALKALTK